MIGKQLMDKLIELKNANPAFDDLHVIDSENYNLEDVYIDDIEDMDNKTSTVLLLKIEF